MNDETPLRPQPALNFPIRQCANIKLWRLQPKPTIIPHAQTRPKTNFTGSCLTMPRLEGTRLFVSPMCVWTWARYGCRVGGTVRGPKFKVKMDRENEKVICPHRFVHAPTHTCTDFSHSHSGCRRSFRQRPRGERAIITSTMRLSHGLSSGMSLHEHCPPSTERNAAAAHVLSCFNKNNI